uniref:Uncharacterized protein n=1 Tax=Arundo donax TaxID=35708 RepID=A0A0A8ZXM8_ARUDO
MFLSHRSRHHQTNTFINTHTHTHSLTQFNPKQHQIMMHLSIHCLLL